MKRALLTNDSSWYIYLPKPMLQLMNLEPKNAKVIFTIKNKILHVENAAYIEFDGLINPLIKKLIKKGNSWSLYIPLTILELLDVFPETDMVDITIENRTLLIKKAL